MRRWNWLCIFVLGMGGTAMAEDLPQPLVNETARAYQQGAYAQAFEELAGTPGLLGAIPLLDGMGRDTRARIFFELGRISLAAGDTTRAQLMLNHVYTMGQHVSKGVLPLAEDDAYRAARSYLRRFQRQQRKLALASTSRWFAAGRSLILPGWGQIYRGHKKRGYVLMGTAAALGVVWVAADRAYQNAYDAYRKTSLGDLKLPERQGTPDDPAPFNQRFERAESRAKTANIALGMVVAVWISSVVDNLFLKPGQLEIRIPIP